MEITKEELAVMMDETAIKAVEASKAKQDKEMDKRFVPGSDDINLVNSPEDKILSSKRGGFKSAGHFFSDVLRADANHEISDTLKTWANVTKDTYMAEGDMNAGGYLVPEEFSARILEKSLEASIVRPRASIQPMASNRLVIPADADADHSTNYFGGITIYRPGEGGTKTSTNPAFARVALTLHKVTGLCYVSDELLSDSAVALEAYLTRKFSQAIAFVEDDDFLNGTGVNQPLGAFSSANPARIAVTAETGQGAATIVAENIAKMWARMYPAGQANAVWVANIECFPQLFQMSLTINTGGALVWMPAGGISGNPYETLMGKPLIYTEKMQALGTAGDIGLVDFSQYIIGQKSGGTPDVASSIHVRFATDETAFRFVLRYDGQPSWLTYITPKRGSATLSPFIVLSSTRT